MKNLKIHAIIQARTGSTRLPGKVFMNLADKPLLWHVVNRLKPSKYLSEIIVATTDNPADDSIEEWCKKEGISYFRGSENNVLDRYYQCAKKFESHIIVRITADDPFKDYVIMDQVIENLIHNKLDFSFNNKPATYPEGLDIEVFTIEALTLAANLAIDPFEKEHVTQYFHRHIANFKYSGITQKNDLSYLRWTIDLKEDFDMAAEVYNFFKQKKEKINELPFLTDDIIQFLQKNPEIEKMNTNVTRSFMFLKK